MGPAEIAADAVDVPEAVAADVVVAAEGAAEVDAVAMEGTAGLGTRSSLISYERLQPLVAAFSFDLARE